MLQVICDCGRIAEVRHRKNGKRLAYTHCTKCGGSVVNTAKAALIEENAREDIGKKGEFFKIDTQSVQSSDVVISKNFIPEPENMPGILEPDINSKEEAAASEGDCKSSSALSGVKIFLGIVLASAFGITAYKVNKG